jgi:hypothetical protein
MFVDSGVAHAGVELLEFDLPINKLLHIPQST